ncbi:hypothetical protein ACPV40_14780 [Vibrio alfacsensis]|uniref:hypothetical protein n=1 Tax=Vibrio alfacsensis TaxID=1074311 RepID=UPI0040686C63
MFTEKILTSIIGWAFILGALFWYSNKKRHPDRSPLNAFLVLISIVFSVMALTIIVVVNVIYMLGQEYGNWGSSLGAIIGLFVVVPTWYYAVSKIKSAPKRYT